MKRLMFVTGILALSAPMALAQASTWKIDPAHSEVGFTVRHMTISNVHGRFAIKEGTIQYNETDPGKSSVNVTIDVNSVDTGVSGRDNDLKGDSFFNVAANPTATFASTSVAKSGTGLTVTGNLTLHGVTKPITLDVPAPAAPITNPMDHKQHAGFSATTKIKRTDFGVGTKFPEAMLSDEIKMEIDIEAAKQ